MAQVQFKCGRVLNEQVPHLALAGTRLTQLVGRLGRRIVVDGVCRSQMTTSAGQSSSKVQVIVPDAEHVIYRAAGLHARLGLAIRREHCPALRPAGYARPE